MYFVYLERSGIRLESAATLTKEQASAWCKEVGEAYDKDPLMTAYGCDVLDRKEIPNAG